MVAKSSIFRLEDQFGGGIYVGSRVTLPESMRSASNCNKTHPNPWNDPGICDFWENAPTQYAYRFGFASIAQLHGWMTDPDWLRELSEQEILVSRYDIATHFFKASEKQAIFNKNHATLIGQCPCGLLVSEFEHDRLLYRSILQTQE